MGFGIIQNKKITEARKQRCLLFEGKKTKLKQRGKSLENLGQK